MIETTIPEIKVSELMERIHAKAAEIGRMKSRFPFNATGLPRVELPSIGVVPPPPAPALPRPATRRKERLLGMLEQAREKTEVSSWIPKPLRRLFRKQGGFNRLLLESATLLTKTNEELINRVQELTRCVEVQHEWLQRFQKQSDEADAWRNASAQLSQATAEMVQHAGGQTNDKLASLLAEIKDVGERKTPIAAPGARETGDLDAFYFNFENSFRGPRQEIKERLGYYLPVVRESDAGTADRPILDLGCGRGEWLELLGESGLIAYGVDSNFSMLEVCREHALEVVHADMLDYLRSLPDESLGGITGFHIIEHLKFETLMEVLGESQRTLTPGGFVILESPNCKNFVVGACNFYSDPTHRNPVFPDTAAFMLGAQGFERTRIEYLRPVEGHSPDSDSPNDESLNNWFYGPRDFAVIAYKGLGA